MTGAANSESNTGDGFSDQLAFEEALCILPTPATNIKVVAGNGILCCYSTNQGDNKASLERNEGI